MLKRIAMTMFCVASLSGCASFISGGTGSAPVGTENGARSLGQVFLDFIYCAHAKIHLYKLTHALSSSVSILKVFMAMFCSLAKYQTKL